MAFLLNDKYATDTEKQRLKVHVIAKFGKHESDIAYLPFDYNIGRSYYFFVRDGDDDAEMRRIYESRKEAFDDYGCHGRITDEEFREMTRGTGDTGEERVKYGDLVIVKTGKYRRLHGIVLRETRNGLICVGMKFCFGVVVETYHPGDLEITGNIFNHLKVIC